MARLRSLSLSGCKKLDDTILQNLYRLPTLSHLDISHCDAIADIGISEFIERQSDRLEYLAIDGENYSDAIFQCIGRCKELHTLHVNFCQSLSDAALEALADMPKLGDISMEACDQFTAAGLQ